MANRTGMSGMDLRAVAAELRDLLPLWTNKCYQFDQKILGVRLNGEQAKYHLLIEAGRRLHLVSALPPAPKLPPQFAMLLRKHIEGGRVLDVTTFGIQRILTFDIGKRQTVYHLVAELFGEGNVILCDADWTIVKPLWHHRFKDREIVPGAVYSYPGRDVTGLPEEEFAAFLSGEDRDIVRALAVGAMLGGTYAEYVCSEAGIDRRIPARSADPGKVYRAVQELIRRIDSGRDPVISGEEVLPFPLKKEEEARHFSRFNDALDSFYPPYRPETPHPTGSHRETLTREQVIRMQQEGAVRKFREKIEGLQAAVNAIYEHYGLVSDIIRTLDAESRRRPWQEIETLLASRKEGPGARIVKVHPESASVELDLGVRVRIFVHDTLEVNVGRYYDEIKKYRRKADGALRAMEVRLKERPPQAPKKGLKRRWYMRYRWFFTSDGVLVLGGRDAGQNEELVKKYMEGGDSFVHADVHGASVVIVKGRTERMDEAARFAASYSGAWRSGHASADVYSARPDQVSKTPEAGEYVSRGSFIVRGERTWFRGTPLAVAIGLAAGEEPAIIGGPPSAVTPRSRVFAELRPGRFEPNDTAKKVLRKLRSALSDEEAKAVRNVMNTEQVAAFVPPGGSDIAGEE